VFHSDHVVLVVLVVVVQVLQDLQLYTSLKLELLLVADDFDSDCLLSLVIQTLDSLTEAPLAKERKHFVAEGEVVVEDNLVVSLLVVVAVVEDTHLLQAVLVALHLLERALLDDVALDLLLAVLTQVVDLVAVLTQLSLLVVIEDRAEMFERIRAVERERGWSHHWRLRVRTKLPTQGRLRLLWVRLARFRSSFARQSWRRWGALNLNSR